jgi:protein phosphatase
MSNIPAPGQPVILFAEECDRGTLRDENQDSVLHVQIALGELMIVADGIGGYAGGAIASRMTVEHFYAHLAALPYDYSAGNALREAAARANTSIVAAARAPNSPHLSMGSTVVVALLQHTVDGTFAWIGHIGDSRAYLLRAGRLHQLTIDHSAVQSLLNRGLISSEEVKNHPDASVLTRSLGHLPEVEIDIEQHPLAIGDTLLLCSDGLWGLVSDGDIQRAVDVPSQTLETAAHGLLELALAAGGNDNISIEMARLVGYANAAPAPTLLRPISHHTVLWVVITVFMLAFAGFCVMAYFALLRH